MDNSRSETLKPQSRLMRNPEILASEIDDEMVMMDEAQGLYFGLNPMARKVWELLGSPVTYESLLNSLLESYEVESQQCKTDVEPFLLDMIEHRLIQVVLE